MRIFKNNYFKTQTLKNIFVKILSFIFQLYSWKKEQVTYLSLNAIVAQPKKFPFGVNTTIELKNMTYKSDCNGIWLDTFELTRVLILSDIAVVFLSSVVILTPNGQFLDCASTAFSERYMERHKRVYVLVLCVTHSVDQRYMYLN